jgi:hypothetical protein
MIFLGCYGIIDSLRSFQKKRAKKYNDIEESIMHDDNKLPKIVNEKLNCIITNTSSQKLENKNEYMKKEDKIGSFKIELNNNNILNNNNNSNNDRNNYHNDFNHENDCVFFPLVDMKDPLTQKIISFCIGLLHGVAGPGGILGFL